MARPRKETDLKALAKERYEGLLAKRNMIDWEVKAIEAYLKSLGEVRAKRRGRRKKTETASEKPLKTVAEGKAREPKKKAEVAKPKKRNATRRILSLIVKSEQGISIDQIMKQTRLGRQTVNGVLNRIKKEGKVKAAKRGVYVKA
jgi:hypothetical protein